MKNQDERRFADVVNTIDAAEKDVDKVLDAARLERHEGPQMRLTGEQKYEIVITAIIVGAFVLFFLGMALGPLVLR